jgi:hypothetical protein
MELALAFERSEAVERFERIERAAVLNSVVPGCGDFDPACFQRQTRPYEDLAFSLTEKGPRKVET